MARDILNRAQQAPDARRAWQRLPPEQSSIYKRVIGEARKRNVRFAVGGGLAAMIYAGQWRNTKDIDLYVLPRDREAMIGMLTDLGLEDYYEQHPYDRNWIYRSYKDDDCGHNLGHGESAGAGR